MSGGPQEGLGSAIPSSDAIAAESSVAAVVSAASEAPGVAAYVRFLSVAFIGLVLDLWSKHWAFHTLKQASKPRVIIENVLEFQTMLNKGALFGIGAGRTTLFLVASVVALVLVFWMLHQTPRRRWGLHIALGGILAGALGNMYDRVFVRLDETPRPVPGRGMIFVELAGQNEGGYLLEEYPKGTGGIERRSDEPPALVGCVRDFIKIPTKWRWFGKQGDVWPWVFNVADMLLVGGVSILAIHLLRDRKQTANTPVTPGA